MHEVSIAQEIIEIIRKYLPDNEPSVLKSVKIAIGEFSNIQIDSLKFGYDILTKDTNLQNSGMIIESIPLLIKCHECGDETRLDEPFFYCSQCNSSKVEIISGTEMKIIEIELFD